MQNRPICRAMLVAVLIRLTLSHFICTHIPMMTYVYYSFIPFQYTYDSIDTNTHTHEVNEISTTSVYAVK